MSKSTPKSKNKAAPSAKKKSAKKFHMPFKKDDLNPASSLVKDFPSENFAIVKPYYAPDQFSIYLKDKFVYCGLFKTAQEAESLWRSDFKPDDEDLDPSEPSSIEEGPEI